MNISLKWLSDYVDISGITVDEIVDKITNAGLEVDEVIDGNKVFENFVVGHVKEVVKHPNADKLTVCQVSDGNDTFSVVCGAPNVAANQKVAFAKVGAILPSNGFQLKKAKIRGEVSFGMICAEDELGLSDDHEGILILDENLKEGTSLASALGTDDVMLDIAITPNRADALSHIGVARDVAALFNLELKIPEVSLVESERETKKIASVEIKNAIDCPRYVAKVVENVTIKESPEWLKKKLLSVGLRPINNVVDITNYVLHEVGQPLHAFDLDELAESKIIVKSAGNGDKFITLDSKERKLLEADLMICDAKRQVAIAGVMGGENSEVSNKTKNILIESAYFRPSAVRKTSKLLGLQTDASYRFERGCNPDITIFAAERCAQLIAELGDGSIAKGIIDVYPDPIEKKSINLRYDRVTKILGFEISNREIREIFLKLGFVTTSEKDTDITVEIPLFRPDIEREIDLIEEVIRIYGFEKIPSTPKISVSLDEKIDQYSFSVNARDTLISLGCNEIITNSLWNEAIATSFGNPVGIINPQNMEMSHLRPSLLPGILTTISKNIKVKESNLRVFEIGHTFSQKSEVINSFDDFIEEEHLMVAFTGKGEEKKWYNKERETDFFDLKGLVSDFLFSLVKKQVADNSYHFSDHKMYDLFFELKLNKSIIASGGKLNKEVTRQFDIKQDVFILDFNLDFLEKIASGKIKFSELLKYPKVIRDFAFVVDEEIIVGEILKTIKSISSPLLQNIMLFDIFEGGNIEEGKKSVTFKLEYFDYSKTLTDDDVDKEFWKAIETVKTKFNAQLRG